MKRAVLVQVIVFVALGIVTTVVGVRYVLGPQSLGGATHLHAHLEDARGIGSGTSVTYRGVQVGEVASLSVAPGGRGSDAVLSIDPGVQIPAGSTGRVVTATAIGILSVDIEPDTDQGPFLGDGDALLVPAEDQGLRLDQLLVDMTALVESLDAESIVTLGETWGTALDGTGPELQALLENADALSRMVADRAPAIASLLDEGLGLVDAMSDNAGTFPGSMRAVRDVSDQLVGSRDSLVYLVDRSPEALARTEELFAATRDDFGVLLTNLVTVGR